jgi:hypothetical protein
VRLGRRELLFACVVVAVALVLSAAAWADNYKFRFNAADQAAARAAVLQRADLGTAVSWKGGATKPDLSAQPNCPNYHPVPSDLVVSGAAESDFSTTGLELDSEAELLQTASMVRLDWQRSLTPALLPCLRSQFARTVGAKLVSLKRIAFPHVATHTAAFRILVDVAAAGSTAHVMVDVVLIGRGRTEISLRTTAPFANTQVVTAAEVRLARILVSRIRD